jgi:hypothetical protein
LVVLVTPGSFGISSGEANISFDPNVFEVVDVSPGTLLGTQPLVGFRQIDNTSGTVKIAMARIGTTPVPSSEGQFAIVEAVVKGTAPAGEYEVRLDLALADHQFNSVGTQVTGANVVVSVSTATPTATPTPTPEPTATLTPTPIPNLVIILMAVGAGALVMVVTLLMARPRR